MKIIGDKYLSVINLGAAACAAASATDIVTTGGAGLATLAATGTLANAVGAQHRKDFEKYIKKAQKAVEEEIAINAFITKEASQADIDATYSALGGAISAVNPTVKDFSDWGLDPETVANELVGNPAKPTGGITPKTSINRPLIPPDRLGGSVTPTCHNICIIWRFFMRG